MRRLFFSFFKCSCEKRVKTEMLKEAKKRIIIIIVIIIIINAVVKSFNEWIIIIMIIIIIISCWIFCGRKFNSLRGSRIHKVRWCEERNSPAGECKSNDGPMNQVYPHSIHEPIADHQRLGDIFCKPRI